MRSYYKIKVGLPLSFFLFSYSLSSLPFLSLYFFFFSFTDEVILPLILETIPTAKEFKAKVNSLSPEQQAFSKAYRALQLASTLFGIMVLPIEPQLGFSLFLSFSFLPIHLLTFFSRKTPQSSKKFSCKGVGIAKRCPFLHDRV